MNATVLNDVKRVELPHVRVHAIGPSGLWICLAQLKGRLLDDIENDRPAPDNVRVIEQLFAASSDGGACHLTANAQPNQTCVVICPEYAFGSGDWQRLDALVASFHRNLILIAAFGASPIAAIDSIKQRADQSGTQVHEGWTTPITGQRKLNFGAVWIKSGGSRECILFGKTLPEQSLEATNLEIVEFAQTTEILLGDFRILPAICADLVRRIEPGGTRTPAQRMTEAALRLPLVPTLCAACLLQSNGQASLTWQQAIDRLVGALGGAHAMVVLCNVAADKPDNRAGGDTWRNLSGIYVGKQFHANGQQQDQPESSYFELVNLMAWPVRSWRPHAIFGTARFPPYGAGTGLHPWRTFGRRELGNDLPEYRWPPLADEIWLLCHVSGLGPNHSYFRQSEVLEHLDANTYPGPLHLVAQLLDGPFALPASVNDLPRHPSNVRSCVAGLNALLETSRRREMPLSWQSQAGRLGQLNLTTGAIALWYSGTMRQDQMLSALRDTLQERLLVERLVIFGRGTDDGLDPATWEGMCDDLSRPVDASEYADLSVTEPAPLSISVVVRSFRYITRLIETAWTTANQDGFPEFERVMAECEGE